MPILVWSGRQRTLVPFTARAIGALLLLAACEDNDITTKPPVLRDMTVAVSPATVVVGQEITATTAGIDQFGASISTGTVTWSSSATGIAVVSSGGVVMGVAPGTSVIAATAGSIVGRQTITVTAPVLTTISVTAPATAIIVGQTVTAAAGAQDQINRPISAGTVVWSTGSAAIAVVSASGVVTGVSAGTTAIVATAGGKSGQVSITVNAVPAIVVNEVESSGGTPGDWIEFYNLGATPVNLGGFIVKDSDDTRIAAIPAGTIIAPGGYYVFDTETAVGGYGLGSADAARLFHPSGVLIDAYAWTSHAAITYGRCPDGTGAFSASASTRGAANSCAAPPPPPPPVTLPWPGSDDVTVVDGLNVFATNGSGLTYEGAVGANPAVLWAVRNGPGTLFRMIFSGGIWTPDPANNWTLGKLLKYIDGTGNPDTEGVTFAAGGSAGGMYASTERNNDASSVSRSVILRVNPTAVGATLTATNQWDITADLPVTGANLGIEAITWIPDSMLVANGFYDESKARLYAPADYPDHAGGLFLVGVEANGNVYAYALNHTNNTFTRVTTFGSGFTTLAGGSSIMDLAYDRESGYLWAVCDDSCNGTTAIFEIDRTVGSPTLGRFKSNRSYARPSTMPNINNEGFTFAPNSECVANRKPVFWADDNETAGHTIRKATLPCGTFAPLTHGIGASSARRR